MIIKNEKNLMIEKMNEVGILDITCNTYRDETRLTFCIEIETKDGASYHIIQEVTNRPVLEDTEILYFNDSEDDGKIIANLGKGHKGGI